MKRQALILILSFLIISCSRKFNTYGTNYTFKSRDGKPHYDKLDYWAAHPWKKDPSDSIPSFLEHEVRDSLVDVFFIHPTSFLSLQDRSRKNAWIDDAQLNKKTDFTNILYQASVFNQHCRVFAPRYRQAHILTFIKKQDAQTQEIYDLAYEDIKTAFEYYMQYWNRGRSIVIAGHSQGAMLGQRLLKEYFENKPLQQKLVVSYLPGWLLPRDYFTSIKMCADSIQTGCLCSWMTFRENFVPSYLKKKIDNIYATNPLTWTIDDRPAANILNKGSILFKFNKLFEHTTAARTNNGLLWVTKPKIPFSYLSFTKNYHTADYRLFYMNIRQNVERRILAFQKN